MISVSLITVNTIHFVNVTAFSKVKKLKINKPNVFKVETPNFFRKIMMKHANCNIRLTHVEN